MARFRLGHSHTIKGGSVLHFDCLVPFEMSNIVLPLKMSGGLNLSEKTFKIVLKC